MAITDRFRIVVSGISGRAITGAAIRARSISTGTRCGTDAVTLSAGTRTASGKGWSEQDSAEAEACSFGLLGLGLEAGVEDEDDVALRAFRAADDGRAEQVGFGNGREHLWEL